jgi:hypothetical protein
MVMPPVMLARLLEDYACWKEVCKHGAAGSAGGVTARQGCFSGCAGHEVCHSLLFLALLASIYWTSAVKSLMSWAGQGMTFKLIKAYKVCACVVFNSVSFQLS